MKNEKEWEGKGTYYMYAHTILSIRKSIILQISSYLSFFSIISLISIYLLSFLYISCKISRPFQVQLSSRSCLKQVTVVPKHVATAPNRVIVIELVVPRKEVVTEAVEELKEEEEVVVKVAAEQSSSALHSLEHIFYPLHSPFSSFLSPSSSLLIHQLPF
jgi:hypothetical protein